MKITNTDISYCNNTQCALKDTCIRYIHSYDRDNERITMFSGMNVDCEYYIERKDNGRKTIKTS